MPESDTNGTSGRVHYTERRREIKRVVEEAGLWNLSVTQLADKYNVSRKSIYNDLDAIAESLSERSLARTRLNISLAFKKATKECHRILAKSRDPKEQLEAADKLSKIAHRFAKFCGFLEPEVEIQNNIQQNIQFNQIIEEAQKRAKLILEEREKRGEDG